MTIIKYYITPAVYCRRAQKIQLWTDTPFKTFLYNVAETLRRRAAFPLSKGNSRKHTVTYSNPLPATLTIYTLSAQLCSPWGLRGLVFFFGFVVELLSSRRRWEPQTAGRDRLAGRPALRCARPAGGPWAAESPEQGGFTPGRRTADWNVSCASGGHVTLAYTHFITFAAFYFFSLKASCKPLKKRLNFSKIYVKLTKK